MDFKSYKCRISGPLSGKFAGILRITYFRASSGGNHSFFTHAIIQNCRNIHTSSVGFLAVWNISGKFAYLISPSYFLSWSLLCDNCFVLKSSSSNNRIPGSQQSFHSSTSRHQPASAASQPPNRIPGRHQPPSTSQLAQLHQDLGPPSNKCIRKLKPYLKYMFSSYKKGFN